MPDCDACGAGPAFARISQWPVETARRRTPGPSGARRLCVPCAAWLCRVLGLTAGAEPLELHGMPTPGGRRLHIADQCRLCRLRVGPDGRIIVVDLDLDPPLRQTALVCAQCRTWLSTVTADLRSVRGLATRSIDGPYGSVPHGWVAPLSVNVDVDDAQTHELVTAIAMRMGAYVVENDEFAVVEPDVRFVELRGPPDVLAHGEPRARMIALVPYALRAELAALARIPLADWITLPATPQQVAHVLLRAHRYPNGLPRNAETGLPIAVEPAIRGPVLAARLAPGSDPQSVAWQLRRYARGYDEVVASIEGSILVIPRCEPAQLERVARRLDTLLEGNAQMLPAKATPRRRLDLSG